MRHEKWTVLLLDDGEVPCAQLWLWLRQAGAELVVARDYFELPALLAAHVFDVLSGNEVLAADGVDAGAAGRRGRRREPDAEGRCADRGGARGRLK